MAIVSCQVCNSYVRPSEVIGGVCRKCRDHAAREADSQGREAETMDRLDKAIAAKADLDAARARIVLTTETAHNLPVTERIDIVTAECVFGMHLFKDVFSEVRDIFGGRSAAVQNTMRDAKRVVLTELRKEAHAVGADAVVGVTINYSEFSGKMLMVTAVGTAVTLS